MPERPSGGPDLSLEHLDTPPKQRAFSSVRSLLIPLLLGLAATAFLVANYRISLELTRDNYRAESEALARRTSHEAEEALRELYTRLRALSRLPAVRRIDRHAENFDADADATFQELFNCASSSLRVSEVYIVPLGLQPDEIDPKTGRLQRPILTYDEIIVEPRASYGLTAEGEGPEWEELEIHEYRLLPEQLDWMLAHFPTLDTIQGLDVPAIGGPEVLTCDTTLSSPRNPDDRDRSGLVYSVPFYGQDGRLKGMISAVILTRVIQDLIADGPYALVNRSDRYVIASPTLDSRWLPRVERGEPDPSLIYSQVFRVDVVEGRSPWLFWAGRPDSDYWSRADVRVARQLLLVGLAGVWLFCAALAALLAAKARWLRIIETKNAELEGRVLERTAELRDACYLAEQASRAKSEFLASMSHELRTPLAAVLGLTESVLAGTYGPVPSAQQEALDSVLEAGRHLLSLINDILDLSKLRADKLPVDLQPVSVEKLCQASLHLIRDQANKKGQGLRLSIEPFDVSVHTDFRRFQQILVNLLSNAHKFTPEGGQIGLKVRRRNGNVEFCVWDTGIGISAEDLPHLFEPFVQLDGELSRRYEGTGLGLALVSELAEALGAQVAVESVVGEGSRFTVTLARADA